MQNVTHIHNQVGIVFSFDSSGLEGDMIVAQKKINNMKCVFA